MFDLRSSLLSGVSLLFLEVFEDLVVLSGFPFAFIDMLKSGVRWLKTLIVEHLGYFSDFRLVRLRWVNFEISTLSLYVHLGIPAICTSEISRVGQACLAVHHSLTIDAVQILLLPESMCLLVDTFNPLLQLRRQLVVETSFEIVFNQLFLLLQRLQLRGR